MRLYKGREIRAEVSSDDEITDDMRAQEPCLTDAIWHYLEMFGSIPQPLANLGAESTGMEYDSFYNFEDTDGDLWMVKYIRVLPDGTIRFIMKIAA